MMTSLCSVLFCSVTSCICKAIMTHFLWTVASVIITRKEVVTFIMRFMCPVVV